MWFLHHVWKIRSFTWSKSMWCSCFRKICPFVAFLPPYWLIVWQETGYEFATSPDSKISGFTNPHVIGFVADLFFSTLENGFENIWISLSNSPDAFGRSLRLTDNHGQKSKLLTDNWHVDPPFRPSYNLLEIALSFMTSITDVAVPTELDTSFALCCFVYIMFFHYIKLVRF